MLYFLISHACRVHGPSKGPLFWRATLAQGAGPAPVDAEKLPLRARNPNRSLQRKSGNFGICFALV